jgi:HPt (histidine-containing phosphotransfer) domain-containing protein
MPIDKSQRRYPDLLESFNRDAQTGFPLLEKEPDDISLRSFITLTQALKSALSNIGADSLSQMSAVLETAGREADIPVIRDKLPSFREGLAGLTARISAVLELTRNGDDEKRVEPATEKYLMRLREAVQAKDIDALDSALARLQDLPLTGKTRVAVFEQADFILIADFGKAADMPADLLNRSAATSESAGR